MTVSARDADAQEGQRGLEHHRGRDVQGGEDEYRAEKVREDVDEHDPPGPGPQRSAASMYSFSFTERVWPRTIRKMPAQEKKVITPITMVRLGRKTAEGEREDDERKRQRSVDEPGQHRVDHSAEVPGDQADAYSGDGRHRGGSNPTNSEILAP